MSDQFVELIPMREDERIDPETVGAFLEGKLPGAQGVPEIDQFEGGKANLTYRLRYPGHEYVLRRPPLGPVAPKSHDMGREYRVLSALYSHYPLAPRAFLFNEDESIVGAPFLVMERRTGIVIRQEMPQQYLNQPDLFRRMSEAMVDALVALHKVDYKAAGLEKLGRPDGFLERQVKGWFGRWDAAKLETNPVMEKLLLWLEENIPTSGPAALVHNDFKLDNMMVDGDDPARIVGVFDWDMCTLGDPLADLGSLLGYWSEASDTDARSAFRTMPTHLPGFYDRAQVAARYGEKMGVDLTHLDYYHVFALFKLAVIVQQIYVRFVRGQTKDTRFQDYGPRVDGLVQSAWNLVESAQ